MLRTLSPTSLGVVLALLAYGVYATADAMIKGLGGTLGIFEIGLFTTLFSLIPAAFSKPKGETWRGTFRLGRPWLVHLIGITRMLSAVLITYSFVTIPLAEAYCIVFMIPVAITVLSVVVLREEVDLLRWGLVVISFLGVLLVVRPGFRELELGHITAIGCAISAAISVIAMRIVSGTEKRTTLFVVPALYTLAANAAGLVWLGFIWPSALEFGALLICGILGGVGFLLQIAAVAIAPTSRIAPMQYSQIVWALVYGAVFFAEFPDAVAMVGLAVVVAAGVTSIFSDGARARIAGRWAAYRTRRGSTVADDFKGPGPDPV